MVCVWNVCPAASTKCNVLFKNPSALPFTRFIRVGGYKLLNSWLTYSKTTNNTPLLQLILLTLQKLPLKVDHLKQVLSSSTPHPSSSQHIPTAWHALLFQNNTAKLVKQLSKSAETEGQSFFLVSIFSWGYGCNSWLFSNKAACLHIKNCFHLKGMDRVLLSEMSSKSSSHLLMMMICLFKQGEYIVYMSHKRNDALYQVI